MSEEQWMLGLALGELRSRRDLRERLGMNPKVLGRPAITGRQGDAVWNFHAAPPLTEPLAPRRARYAGVTTTRQRYV
jgi:hypothetical protein